MHKFYILFNGEKDLDLGILPIKRPNFPALNKKYNSYSIDGKNGDLYEFLGYEDRVLTIEYNFLDKINIHNKVRKITKWLNKIEDNRIVLGDDPQYFYKVKKVEYEDIERKFKRIGKFNVVFTLEPFAYQFLTNLKFELNNNDKIYNDGDFESYPIFEIKGNGCIKLFVNDNLIELNISDEIIINSEKELCFKNNEIRKTIITGDFPILKIGLNNIHFEGDIKEITINPNCMYY